MSPHKLGKLPDSKLFLPSNKNVPLLGADFTRLLCWRQVRHHNCKILQH
jgi:hypothetical protein